jgi:hypothetical protein
LKGRAKLAKTTFFGENVKIYLEDVAASHPFNQQQQQNKSPQVRPLLNVIGFFSLPSRSSSTFWLAESWETGEGGWKKMEGIWLQIGNGGTFLFWLIRQYGKGEGDEMREGTGLSCTSPIQRGLDGLD